MKTINWIAGETTYICEVEPSACPFCYRSEVIVQLPPHILAEQPDDTTHVCHPQLGGCNHGFVKPKQAAP